MFSQAPQKMSYQVVIRNSSNALVTSSTVGMQVSILQGSISGTEVYKEIYSPNPQTNVNGLVTLEIGSGTPVIGSFATIDWSAGSYFIKTEIDPLGGTSYTISGTTQLLSVPYSLYSETAGSVKGGINETDPVFINHAAHGITSTNISNWNTAYSWGNHAGLYSLLSHTHPYLSLLGGEMANTNIVTNLNADLLDGQHGSFYAPAAGSGSYIQNQNSSAQSGNIWISGDSKIGGRLYVNGLQSIYIPNQNNFNGSLVIGTGGLNLSKSPPISPSGFAENLGSHNTFVGIDAGMFNAAGNQNTFVGTAAGYQNTVGDQNTFIGMNAGTSNTTGWVNTFVGAWAGQQNTTGRGNAFFGTDTGNYNTTGNDNSFFGGAAGYLNTAGNQNAFFGTNSGTNNNAGDNSFFGSNAGFSTTTGEKNSFFGSFSGYANTIGIGNSFFGYLVAQNNISGSNNAFFGERSGRTVTSGSYNVAIGAYSAATNFTTGSNNTFLGSLAGSNDLQKTDAINSMALGYGAYTTADNQVVIGNNGITSTVVRNMTTSNSIASTAPIGIPPFSVLSTTLNTNLNADLLDGQHGSYYAPTSVYPSIGLTTGYLPYKSNTALANSPIYTNGTNVGFGTTSPVQKVHIQGSTMPTDISTEPLLILGRGIGGGSFQGSASFNLGRYKIPTNFQAFTRLDINLRTNSLQDNYNTDLNAISFISTMNNVVNTGIGYSTGTEIENNKMAVNGTGYFNGTIDATGYKISGISTLLAPFRTGFAGTTGQILISKGSTTTPVWSSIGEAGIAPASGSSNYIQNQYTSAQSGNIWISGDIKTRQITITDGYGLNCGNFQVGGIAANRFYVYNLTKGTDNFVIYPSSGNSTFRYNLGVGYGSEATEVVNNKLAVNGSIYVNGIITATGGKSTDWNIAYGWGNHAGLYRPVSYVPAWSEITSNPFAFSSVTDGQLLKYNAATAKWENWTPNSLATYNETDPVFAAWNKTSGITITTSQISDFQIGVTNNETVLANTAKNSYPIADAAKLANIAAGAEVNVNADWNATSGDAQILNKPTIAVGTNQGDMQYWNGTEWVVVPAGQPGQFLQFTTENRPAWTTVLPLLTTTAITAITNNSASSGGNIASSGGGTITARGVCWSTSPNPTIADNKTTDGTGTGLFTSLLTGLTSGITYYLRAYATNSSFTAYGNEVSFSTAL